MDERGQRRIHYDRDLGIEAYNLSGIVQRFPNHFHEYCVIGFVEGGGCHLYCEGQEYDVEMGDLLSFNLRDNYFRGPISGEVLDYRVVNVPMDVMNQAVLEIMEERFTLHFAQDVVRQSEITQSVDALYDAVLDNEPKLKREEAFFFLLEQVLREYTTPFEDTVITSPDEQIQMLCDYTEKCYTENTSLGELLSMAGFGKPYLLRVFTKQVGVSPYRYLRNVRLDRAGKLLEQDVVPVGAAVATGFSDQSHFSNFSKEFIGLTSKQYQRISEEDAEADKKGPGGAMEGRMGGGTKYE